MDESYDFVRSELSFISIISEGVACLLLDVRHAKKEEEHVGAAEGRRVMRV